MAKMQVYDPIPDHEVWLGQFGHEFTMDVHSGTSAVFTTNSDAHIKISVRGTGLTYGADGELSGGTVTGIGFSYGGDPYARISELALDAKTVVQAIEVAGALVLINALDGADTIIGSKDTDILFGMNGRDRINGMGGSDEIRGDAGNDILTGGKGSDHFVFKTQDDSRDRILDFDPSGGVGHQDFLHIGGMPFEVEQHGRNTMVSFDDEEIILVGVKPSEIDSSDFM